MPSSENEFNEILASLMLSEPQRKKRKKRRAEERPSAGKSRGGGIGERRGKFRKKNTL